MSAWIVSKRHIDVLVEAAQTYGHQFNLSWEEATRWKGMQKRKILKGSDIEDYQTGQVMGNVDNVGIMLWLENFQSVATRYPDDTDETRPGPTGLSIADVLSYKFTPVQGMKVTPVVALKAIKCYEYQSCEHDEWEGSEAQDFCTALKEMLINYLPGYEEAPWGIDDVKKVEARR